MHVQTQFNGYRIFEDKLVQWLIDTFGEGNFNCEVSHSGFASRVILRRTKAVVINRRGHYLVSASRAITNVSLFLRYVYSDQPRM